MNKDSELAWRVALALLLEENPSLNLDIRLFFILCSYFVPWTPNNLKELKKIENKKEYSYEYLGKHILLKLPNIEGIRLESRVSY